MWSEFTGLKVQKLKVESSKIEKLKVFKVTIFGASPRSIKIEQEIFKTKQVSEDFDLDY